MNVILDIARMSSASYNSNPYREHEVLYQEILNGHQRIKSQSSSASKSTHLRSVQNFRDHQGNVSPGRALKNGTGELKKQKRMLESAYDDDIEKIRGFKD